MSLPESEDLKSAPQHSVREEFRMKHLNCEHDEPALFVKSQCGPRLFYRFWTTFWAAFHLLIIMLQPYFQWESGSLPNACWFIYLTNWGYLTLVVSSIVDCIVTHYIHLRKEELETGVCFLMPWYLKMNWVLFNISSTLALLITILYYTLLSPDFETGSVMSHMVNSVYVLCNIFVCAKPTRILHFYQTLIFAIIYAIFSIIYQFSGGSAIYTVLNWRKPSSAVPMTLGLLFGAIPAMHLIIYGMYRLRVYIFKQHCAKTKVDPLQSKYKDTDVLQMRF